MPNLEGRVIQVAILHSGLVINPLISHGTIARKKLSTPYILGKKAHNLEAKDKE